MASGNETTTKFRVDISELKKGIQDANRQIKLANAEFKAASAGMDDWSKSADGISAKIAQLQKVLQSQKSILASYEKQLELVEKEYGKSSKEAVEMRIKLENQKASVKSTVKSLQDFEKALSDVESGEKDTAAQTEESSKGFTVFKGVLADLVASGIKAAISGLKDLASTAKESFKEFDDGRDAVIKATGATGEAAKELQSSYSEVAKSVVGDFGDIGSALGEVNTRFGYTGKELEDATTKFMKFAHITGTDATAAVQLVSRAMGDAGIDSSEYASVLDELAVAAQASGISVDKLTEYLTKYGAPMRALGFETKEAIAIFSQWEKAGVNTEIAFSGMRNAISKWSADGKDARIEFRKTLDEIASAPDIASATTKAIEVFGKKAGPDLADAIQGGRFEYSQFLDLIEGSEGAVENTFNQTQDASDKVALAFQGMRATIGETVDQVVQKYGPDIEKAIGAITPVIQSVIQWLGEKIPPAIEKVKGVFDTIAPVVRSVFGWILDNKDAIIAALAGIGAAMVAWKLSTVVSGVIGLVKAIKMMGAAAAFAAAKQWLLNTALMANPIGLVVAAIAGLVAAFVVLWKRSEKFRNFWLGLWENIKKVFSGFVEAWGNGIDTIKVALASVGKFFSDTWQKLKSGAKDAWEGIKSVFGAVADWFGDKFREAWERVKAVFAVGGKIFDGIKDGIVNAFKTVVNAIIRGLNKVISIPFNAINATLDKIREVSIAGYQPFKNLVKRFDVPQIPELAQGGVLRRGQIGLLEGNGAEAVVPLDRNKAWIAATAAELKKALGAEGIVGARGAGSTGSTSTTYNFTQYNTSPKALSRLEIYRQSKNLLALKGAT